MKQSKNIQKGLALIIMLIIFNACENVLDQVPSDKVEVDRILSKSSVEGFWRNSYADVPKNFTGHSGGQLLEVYTDDAFRAGSDAVSYKWHNGLLSPSTPLFGPSIWSSCWTGIRKCNLALEYIPQTTASEDVVPEFTKARWIDEVTLLRAWYHFILIKNFGPVPFIDVVYSPGYKDWESLTRPSYDEIAARIVAECDKVITNDNLPMRWENSADYTKVTKAFALALKSRTMLYNASMLNNPTMDAEKWSRAAQAARQAIDSLSATYALVEMEDYSSLFNTAVDEFNPEIIYRSQNNDAGTLNSANGIDLYYYGSNAQSGNCGAVPTQELVDCFELTNGNMPVVAYNNADHTSVTLAPGYSENPGDDPYAFRDARLAQCIVYNGAKYGRMKGMTESDPELIVYTYVGKSGSGYNEAPLSQEEGEKRRSATGYYAKKFRSASYWGTNAGGSKSYKIYFRMAELYLNLAEAECELGNLDQAIAALNVVRLRAEQPAIETVSGFSKTKDFLLKRIRNERRVELCFEGHRFYDQRRWKALESNKTITGMKVISDTGYSSGEFSYQRVKIDVTRTSDVEQYLYLPLSREEARKVPGLGQMGVWN